MAGKHEGWSFTQRTLVPGQGDPHGFTPRRDKAYADGRLAQQSGAVQGDNPFPLWQQDQFNAWDVGWQAAAAAVPNSKLETAK